MGGAFVVGRRWDEIGFGGQAALAIAIAIVGFVAGTWLVRLGEAGTSRLGGFLWGIGTGGAGMLVAVTVDRLTDEPGWVLVAAGTSVLAVGVALWRNLERPLQFLSAVAGFVIVLSGIGELLRIPTWVGSTVLLASGGLLAGAGASEKLVPRDLVTVAGAFGAFVGALSLGEINEHVGPFAALTISAALVIQALVSRRVPVLVVGVLGTLIATQAVLMTTFSGALASMIVAVLGLAVVVVAVTRSLRPDHRRDGQRDLA